jgi:uncharacterized membrane protein YhhN
MTIAGNFITGVLFFAAGHISFLAAYCSIEKLVKIDIIISVIVVITGGTIILVSPFLEVPDEVMQVAGLIYACIISVMTGKAISNYIRVRNFLTQVACIGSILFFMSDIMLVFDWFLGMGSLAWVFCIGMYYPAQTLIAFSSFLCVGCDVTRDEDECECDE